MVNGTAAKAATAPKREGFFARTMQFLRECKNEVVVKSAWPSWPELRQFTLVVIFAVAVVSIWIGGLDFILGQITRHFGQ